MNFNLSNLPYPIMNSKFKSNLTPYYYITSISFYLCSRKKLSLLKESYLSAEWQSGEFLSCSFVVEGVNSCILNLNLLASESI